MGQISGWLLKVLDQFWGNSLGNAPLKHILARTAPVGWDMQTFSSS
jgi:hypothetical protein